jgi:signal transduction histidine kinase
MRGGLGRTLLTAFLLLAIGPLSLVGYVAFSQVRAERQRETVDRLTTLADLEETRLREWLGARRANLENVASDPSWSSWSTSTDEIGWQSAATRLKTLTDTDTSLNEVFLVVDDSSEKWIAASGHISPRPTWAASPQNSQRTTVRFQPPHAGESAVEFVTPVLARSSQPVAFIVGLARLQLSSLPTNAFGLGHASVVYLMNREHRSLILQNASSGDLALRLDESDGAARALAGQSGTATYKNATGVLVIGVYRWLDDLELALVAEQDQAEALARSDELAAGLIGAVLSVALLTTIIAAVVTRQITRPIVLLSEAALQMSGGDLSVRVQPTRRDEIGILSGVFNTMAAELASLYAGLENKVAERTRELQEAKELIQYHAWQLSISAEIGRITTSILDLNTLLARTSDLMRDAFQLDHVAVYLLNPSGQSAILCSNAGRLVPAQERELNMSSSHPIVWVISQRAPRLIVRPADCADCHRLMLPLALGTRSIGAMELTSRDPAGFSESDQSVLQTLAGQLSVAIENAHTYSQEHEAADEMRELDRLRGQFLMRMSHQLATYLNTILGFSKLMLKGVDGPLNETQIKDLTAIRKSSQQLAQLLDDILELASLEVGAIELQFGPVEIGSLLDGLRGSLASLLVNPQVCLDMQAEPGLPTVMADADRLRQVLTNLVMTASEISREGVITVQAERRANRVLFQVVAPGLAAGQESNHTISLALSRRLVDLHGGSLQVEQREGNVTVFGFSVLINGSASQVIRAESEGHEEVA